MSKYFYVSFDENHEVKELVSSNLTHAVFELEKARKASNIRVMELSSLEDVADALLGWHFARDVEEEDALEILERTCYPDVLDKATKYVKAEYKKVEG